MAEADEAAKKALQAEVVAVKQRWAAEVKLLKAAKDVPTYPLPLAVARTVPRPPAADLYDVDELTIRLWVDSLEAREPAPVRVEIAGAVPEALQRRIAEKVDERWRAECVRRLDPAASAWAASAHREVDGSNRVAQAARAWQWQGIPA